LFQQTGSQTQLPQRVHCLKSGLISRTAASRAASCCGPAAIDCNEPAVWAARPKIPPKIEAAASAAAATAPSLLVWKVDM
jgi:hypothetical protein